MVEAYMIQCAQSAADQLPPNSTTLATGSLDGLLEPRRVFTLEIHFTLMICGRSGKALTGGTEGSPQRSVLTLPTAARRSFRGALPMSRKRTSLALLSNNMRTLSGLQGLPTGNRHRLSAPQPTLQLVNINTFGPRCELLPDLSIAGWRAGQS